MFLTSCGGGYKTDVPPPSGKETYKEILPAEIGGVAVDGKKLELDASRYQGVAASYGAGAKLTVLQCKDQAALDEYVKGTVVPGLEEFGSRSSGKFNGVWSLKGSGKTGRIYGWQNGNWLFVIQASNDELFDEVVDKFAYISKE
ncbi:hypothetical protein [Phragmitibacter flavus]|uniref:hypothetical protein n=1 Tax=Phragmitibacter flavus TaxID=2576071 RepID=UPI0010FD406D|nr:hypothetical protein [Phragmitibacter flavus]